jgi:hypothetical protein
VAIKEPEPIIEEVEESVVETEKVEESKKVKITKKSLGKWKNKK